MKVRRAQGPPMLAQPLAASSHQCLHTLRLTSDKHCTAQCTTPEVTNGTKTNKIYIRFPLPDYSGLRVGGTFLNETSTSTRFISPLCREHIKYRQPTICAYEQETIALERKDTSDRYG